MLDKTLLPRLDRLEPFEAALKLYFGSSNSGAHRSPLYGEKS